eukprot:GHVU01162544.1.p1 GENE.GHVU01162544.1~~GHVU01162544.1.p1  ORF type:complete len:111 (+),score=12.12 GHVU01162544.1:1419-1751(+)
MFTTVNTPVHNSSPYNISMYVLASPFFLSSAAIAEAGAECTIPFGGAGMEEKSSGVSAVAVDYPQGSCTKTGDSAGVAGSAASTIQPPRLGDQATLFTLSIKVSARWQMK